MEFDADQITELTATIWQAMLGLPIARNTDEAAPAVTRSIAACVQITGAWDGAVLLDCSADVARRAASIMFSTDEQKITLHELQDAIAELVNMVGGNLKALLPEKCFLSLPAVVEGGELSARVPGSRCVGRVNLECEGKNVAITIRERATTPAVAA